jgi:hypothetical protein
MLAMHCLGVLCDLSESSAARAKAVGWIGRLDWTYRVGEELAEAHFAEFYDFVGCVSVPSLAVCMGLEVVVLCCRGGE